MLHSKMQQAREIVVMDTLGKLAECYAICDLAIIGGSFYDFGGHNPLEPAYYSKPIIIGNHHSSCKDSVAALQMKQAILISFKETLAEDILILLADRDLSVNMGQAARKVLTENAAALQNHMQEIEKYLR
ncbi:MAG: glycosyltransferase [Candidatus Cloacimonetes bacterium]|nr:glycosyltransferase [Candidatus Cloacimonadota bacterium]